MCFLHKTCQYIDFDPLHKECKKCCMNKISLSKNLDKDIKKAWILFYDHLEDITNSQDPSKNIKFSIILAFTSIPNLFLSAIRILFLNFFKIKQINVEALKKGKWLPQNININEKLINSLLTTQQIIIPHHKNFMNAISFFTDQNKPLHRNKAAHDTINALQAASCIQYMDITKNFICISYGIASFDKIVDSTAKKYDIHLFSDTNRRKKRYRHRIFCRKLWTYPTS